MRKTITAADLSDVANGDFEHQQRRDGQRQDQAMREAIKAAQASDDYAKADRLPTN